MKNNPIKKYPRHRMMIPAAVVLLLLVVSLPLYSKDFNKTENIIDTILRESPKGSKGKKGVSGRAAEQGKKPVEKKKKKEKKEKASLSMSSPDEILLKTGISLYNSGMYSEALKRFEEINKSYSGSRYIDSARVWIGKIHIKQYKYDDAIKSFSSVTDNSGEKQAALYYTGESHSLKGNPVSAIEYFERVSSGFPEHELADNALLRIAKIYLAEKKGDQALNSVIRIIKYYETRETIDDAFYLLGKIYEKAPGLKDVETARKVYKTFLSKAKSGTPHFKNSPLKKRVKRDLAYIEKYYLRLTE
ncbi:MAG: tetratricopeptide repeat protein [bacterium]|nr:tetratricopeptide repeat protein [bacterium]